MPGAARERRGRTRAEIQPSPSHVRTESSATRAEPRVSRVAQLCCVSRVAQLCCVSRVAQLCCVSRLASRAALLRHASRVSLVLCCAALTAMSRQACTGRGGRPGRAARVLGSGVLVLIVLVLLVLVLVLPFVDQATRRVAAVGSRVRHASERGCRARERCAVRGLLPRRAQGRALWRVRPRAGWGSAQEFGRYV